MRKSFLATLLFCSLFSSAQTKEYIDLGNEKYKNKDYEGAILDYNKELEKNPKSTAALYNIGISYNAQSKYLEAINSLNKAIEIDANYVLAYISRSKSWNYLKNYDKALDIISKSSNEANFPKTL